MVTKIVEMTRGHLILEMDGKTVKIEGEAYLRGFGSPDFVLYRNSIKHWNPPFEGIAIVDQDRDAILLAAGDCLRKSCISFEIE